MKTSTFSNALVAVVGAYAEAVGEQATAIDQLTAALRSTAAPNPKLTALVEAVDKLLGNSIIGAEGFDDALQALRDARRALR